MNAAVRLQGVRKTFGSATAVQDLDLEVPTGALYGVIGPNSAPAWQVWLTIAIGLASGRVGLVRLEGLYHRPAHVREASRPEDVDPLDSPGLSAIMRARPSRSSPWTTACGHGAR
jgi:ABC-type transporter Mla maintaining outer membrane lipid asymmetry ATPase subunit MlaF